ncbi:hippurate hydrolase [Arthrobacter sp. Hiyo4]|nr:hippurate hydrolase [Arthrobacter sp. Hiyo4]
MLSASDALTVTVLGAGGHGSAPHTAKDPVTAAAEMVTALQVMITRQFNVFDPVVLTVGVLQAGTKRNIIPETARMEATIRTFSDAARERMMIAVPTLLKGIAAAHGLEVDVDYRHEYPLTVNDDDETRTAEKTIEDLFGTSRLTRWATPLSGSEDFSRVLAEVPGTFIGLSAVAPAPTTPGPPSTTPRTQPLTTECCPTEPPFTQSWLSPASRPWPRPTKLPSIHGAHDDHYCRRPSRRTGSQIPPAHPRRHRHRQRR